MRKGSKLTARIPKQCSKCKESYLARQANSIQCDSCRAVSLVKIPCKCGCGKTASKFIKYEGFYRQCWTKDKKYSQIYETKVNCGFKKGIKNPNFTRSNNFKKNKKNKKGEFFRSALEVYFSELCIDNSIPYTFESDIVQLDIGKKKIIDFSIGEILVEISGFAYKKWQDDFKYKVASLRRSTSNPILLLTYPDKLEKIRNLGDVDIFCESIYNKEGILKKINLLQNMVLINKTIICK